MKKTSSDLNVGLWVVGGLVGLYLLGAAAIAADSMVGTMWFSHLPNSGRTVIVVLYKPFFDTLSKLGIP